MTAVAERLDKQAAAGAAQTPVTPVRPRKVRLRRPPMGQTSLVGTIGLSFAFLAGWLLLYAFVLSGVQASRSQANLYDQLRSSVAQEISPYGGVIPTGTPVGLLQIPSIEVHDLVMVEGTASADTRLGPGHLQNTPMPGQAGVSVIYGRSVTFGAPFRNISSLRVGAVITATTGQGVYNYRVTVVARAGQVVPLSALQAPSRITLVTSEGSGWRSGWAADNTVSVVAALQGQTVSAPAAIPATVPDDEQAMASDTGTLESLLLWVQGLLIATAGVSWSVTRLGLLRALVPGVPILLALLWGATSAAGALLPNLF